MEICEQILLFQNPEIISHIKVQTGSHESKADETWR